MYKTLLEVFEGECSHLKIDRDLTKRIRKYVQGFANKDGDAIAFLGNTLIGVHPFRYTRDDNNLWFDEILETDEINLQSEIRSLPSINPEWKIGTNATNLSIVWLVYKIRSSNKISSMDQKLTIIDLLSMLQYKFISSLDAHFFPYPADKAVAIATYAALNRKFSIKQHGSWGRLVKHRAEDIMDSRSIHSGAISKFSSDKDIIYLLNDTQGRYKDVYKRMTAKFYEIREADAKIATSDHMMELEGVMVIKDKSSNFVAYRQYSQEIMRERNGFIRKELTDVIEKAVHTMPPKYFMEALEYSVANYDAPRCKYIAELTSELVVHACNFVSAQELKINDVATIISKLRTIYMASRVSDPQLVKIRDLSEKLVKDSISSRNPTARSAVRTGLCLYLVLRTLAKDFYK